KKPEARTTSPSYWRESPADYDTTWRNEEFGDRHQRPRGAGPQVGTPAPWDACVSHPGPFSDSICSGALLDGGGSSRHTSDPGGGGRRGGTRPGVARRAPAHGGSHRRNGEARGRRGREFSLARQWPGRHLRQRPPDGGGGD